MPQTRHGTSRMDKPLSCQNCRIGVCEMALNHPYSQIPDHFFKYGDLILFDPGEPYNREYICRVVSDIMRRYDVDGIHMDDYFHPYPGGIQKVIPDDKTFAKYNNGIQNRADWRRYNVNELVRTSTTPYAPLSRGLSSAILPFWHLSQRKARRKHSRV